MELAGFVNRGGEGGHRNFVHPKVIKPITISGKPSDEVQYYQERAVSRAIKESQT